MPKGTLGVVVSTVHGTSFVASVHKNEKEQRRNCGRLYLHGSRLSRQLNTGLSGMIVGVLTTCHTQYT